MATKYGTHAEFEHLASVSATSGHPSFYASGSAGSAGSTSTLYLKGPNGNTYDMVSGSILQVAGDSGTGTVSMGTGQSLTIAGGTGLDTTMSGQTLTFSMDLNELSAASVNVANDSIAIVDADDSNGSKKESISDLMTAVAGTVTSTALAASSGVLGLDIQNLTAETTIADGDLVVIDDGAGGTLRKMTRANFIESAALDAINIDGGAIDGTPIGASSQSSVKATTLSGSSTLDVDGAATFNGNVDLGNATSDTITATARFDSDLVPSTDSARDLGTSALQWAEAHVDHGYIDAITATGTSTLTTVDINGGAIDGTTIGAASATTGKFTTLTATSNASVSGSLHVVGDLDVAGNINSVTKTTSILEVEDLNIICASGSNASAADGAGLLLGGHAKADSVAGFTWDNDTSNIEFSIAGSNEALMSATVFAPASSDGMALGSTALMWSDAFLASGAVVNFNNGDVTMTHSANLLAIAGGNTRVERLEIDGASDYIDVDTDLKIIAAADVVIDPAGGELKVDGNVVPNSDSADSLGASGTAWANLYVDAIDLNGQGSISMGGTGRLDLDADDDTSIRASADDVITFEAGGSDVLSVGASALYPASDDGLALGSANNNFSDVFLADAAVLNFGDDQEVTLTHVHNTGLLLSSDDQLQFGDSGTYIHQSSNGVLKAVSDDNIILAAGSANGDYVALNALTSSFGVSSNASPAMLFSGSNANVGMFKWLGSADKFSFMDDISMSTSESIQFRASGNKIHSSTANQLDITSPTVNIDASSNLYLKSDSVTFGENAEADVVLNFNAASNDGVLTWMEDEDYFKFSDDILIAEDEKLLFRDSGLGIHSTANGQLDIDADVELEITAPTLDIDASTAVTITSPSVVIDSSTSDKPVLELKNSNADANPASILFNHDSASPADDDELGEVVFNGDDDGGASTMFAKIVGVSSDVTDGTEDGALQFKFRGNGAVKTVELGAGAGLTLPNDSTYGVVKAHSMVTYSDETLKTNIQPLESALETVNKLQGVSYDWKSDGSRDLGFIAQEVNKVVPQIVYGKGDGDLGLDYSKLTSILVEAVKEQQAQINDLKSKLDK
jgi:hypothetical protein